MAVRVASDAPGRSTTCFPYLPWWAGQPAATICLEGFDARDKIAYFIRTQKTFWDVDQLEYIAMVAPVGGVYLDVGANIGNHAVFFGTFCADHVVAVEPHPRLHDILRRNLDANGLADRCTVVPVGISESAGTGAISLRDEHADNIGASHVVAGQAAAGDGVVTLQRLDDLLDDLAPSLPNLPITFLKIDVEGMEMGVLRSSARLLRTHQPQILVELITETALTTASSLLGDYGYQAVARLGSPPSYHFIVPGRHTLRENKWHGGGHHAHHVYVAEQELASVTAPDAVVVLADLDEGGFGSTIAGRRRLPFLEQDGRYFGPPATDAQALDELDRLRRAGGTHLAVLWPAFWMLETYRDFADALRRHHRCVLENARIAIFELRG